MNTMNNQEDIVIVGGGPAGLSAAINGIIRGYRVSVLDGGATKLSRAERIDNYLGLPGVTGMEIMKAFEDHALSLGVTIIRGKATNVFSMGQQYMVGYGSEVLTARAVILATGALRSKAVEGEEEFLGKGVSYCATCDGMLYRGKKAVVYGLAVDAAEEANYLAGIGVQIVYVNPGPRPKELREDVEWQQGTLQSIQGDSAVKAVEIKGENDVKIETQGVFLLRDAVAPQAMVSGLEIDKGFIMVNKEMKTNLPGLFACGDCTGQPLQISKAAGEGLIAGQEAAKYLDSLS